MGRWKNLVDTAREASEDMDSGDKRFALFLLSGVGITALCVAGMVWSFLNRK